MVARLYLLVIGEITCWRNQKTIRKWISYCFNGCKEDCL